MAGLREGQVFESKLRRVIRAGVELVRDARMRRGEVVMPRLRFLVGPELPVKPSSVIAGVAVVGIVTTGQRRLQLMDVVANEIIGVKDVRLEGDEE